ncbi:amino acid carrier protein [Chryseolinea sp. H1M3-3]|uniref:alanine/glycine:cation symporter family protein n=1 Tax=Chryseolinea sp. H1M3-3 TaxID=3034144 RepID=UPI0023EA8607|nr:amino acid carrier protein [Chryseolinea sp. H1M3-3]
MQQLNDVLATIDSYIGSANWFVYFLLGTGIFFTFYLKFPQIRFFRHAIRIVRGKYDKSTDVGDASHFQALATALSGTVGTGNIAGVALAIHLGGPAALFWMLVTAFLGMTTKFVEVTLSHKYREMDVKGHVAGGPMYYMKNALNMKWLAVIFAVATVLSSFGTGSLPQVNSIANAMYTSFGLDHIITGGILTVILGFIIIGGIKRIAQVSEMLVPFMAILYFIGAISVILYNVENLIPSIATIGRDLFSGTTATGGFLGATVSFAFNRGVNRGLFSNEAGQGSAPIAHAAAKAHEPVSEGMVAILEPFIDTIIICLLTGLAVLSSGAWDDKIQNDFQDTDLIVLDSKYDEANAEDKQKLSNYIKGEESLPFFTGDLDVSAGEITNNLTILHARSVGEDILVSERNGKFTGKLKIVNGKLIRNGSDVEISGKSLLHSAPLTNEAFKRSPFGEYGKYIVTIGLLLFAFSTAISWSYYGDRAVTYLFGAKGVIYYHIVYVIGFFLASFTDTTIIWTLSGITIALMTIPNLVGILLLHKDMKTTLKEYWIGFKKEYPNKKSE